MTDGGRSLVGTVLDRRYRLDAEIGVGVRGGVHRATHLLIDKPMAVAVLRDVGPAQLGRFLEEARLAAKVHHPNVVELSDCGELPGGGAYVVMELLRGEPLSRTLARERTIAPARALGLMAQILAGLRAAHAVGLVHRRLAPRSVLLVPGAGEPLVKLLDFGNVRIDDDATAAAEPGAWEYRAPFTGDRSLGAELETLAAAILGGELRRAAELPDELD